MFKKLLFALLIAFLPTASFAAFAHWMATATSQAGNPLKGYSVKVLLHPSGVAAEVYSDDQGTIKVQPFLTSSSDGTYDFWTNADGDYKIIIYGAFGTYQTIIINATGTTASISNVDLSAYVLVTKAGQQSVTATGAGNDITLTTAASGDDLIFATGDDWTAAIGGLVNFTPAESFTVTTTVGDINLNAADTFKGKGSGSAATPYVYAIPDQAGACNGDESFCFYVEPSGITMLAEEKPVLTINSVVGITVPTKVQGCTSYGAKAAYESIATPVECDTFFDTTLHVPCFYNGTAWKSAIDGTTDCTSGV